MGKNPLSLESTHISARSRSHSSHARAPNVATSLLAAALAHIRPARLRTQVPVRSGARSPATGSPAGLRAPGPYAALASSTSALAGGFALGDASQAVHSGSAAWSLMVGSLFGATGAVAFILWIGRAIGGLHPGAFPRMKSPHKVACTSASGFAPARPWSSSGVICAFLEGV